MEARRLDDSAVEATLAQPVAEHEGIVGLDCREARAAEPEPGKNCLRERDRAHQSGNVVSRFCAQDETHRGRAIGEGRGDRFEPDLRDLVHLHRQDVGRQAVAVSRQRIDQRGAMGLVVKQQHGRSAAGLAIDREEGAQAPHQGIGRGHRVTGGAGRADRSALAAAGADCGVDCDTVAVGSDGPRRAEIETPPAADDVRARMGAEVIGEIDVARLVEISDEIAGAQHRPEHRRRIAGVGAQIAVAKIGGGKQRRPAGEVEQDVAMRDRAIASRTERECAARGRRRCGIVIDGDLERAEMALGRSDRALHDREIGDARR